MQPQDSHKRRAIEYDWSNLQSFALRPVLARRRSSRGASSNLLTHGRQVPRIPGNLSAFTHREGGMPNLRSGSSREPERRWEMSRHGRDVPSGTIHAFCLELLHVRIAGT